MFPSFFAFVVPYISVEGKLTHMSPISIMVLLIILSKVSIILKKKSKIKCPCEFYSADSGAYACCTRKNLFRCR